VQPPIALGVRLPSRIQQGQVGSSQVKTFGSVGRGPLPRPILLQPGPALARQQTEDRQINAVAEAARSAGAQAKGHPLAAANLVEGLSFVGNETILVSHGLGRPFRSALVCAPSTNAFVSIQRPSGIAQDAIFVAVTSYNTIAFDLLVW
jgi:hypothetical protein